MLRPLATCSIGLAALSALLASVAAADVLVGGYITASPSERGVPVIMPEIAAPAHGWFYVRPPDCGVYHYWNGARCVDARYVPPDLIRR